MSYFYLQSKSYLLSHQTENISLATIILLTHFIFTGKKQYSLAMFIKLNKKRILQKRIYSYTHYTYRGHIFTFTPKQPYLSLYWQKYNMEKFLTEWNTKREL